MKTIGNRQADKKYKILAIILFSGVAVMFLGLLCLKVSKILGYVVFGVAGLMIFIPAIMIDLLKRKQEKFDRTAEMKMLYNKKFAEKVELKKYDVKRYPIDKSNIQKVEELKTFTKNFLNNVIFPENFENFLKEYQSGEKEKRFVLDKFLPATMYGPNYYEVFSVVSPEKIKDYNFEFITQKDDYHTMFRNVLFFADDRSGKCHFFLDYSQNAQTPAVKYLNDELDQVSLVASNFQEFAKSLVDEKYIEDFGSIEKKANDFSQWFISGLKKLKPAKNYIVNIYEDTYAYTCELISTNSRDFEGDIDELDVYSREKPFIISNNKQFFDFEQILKHFRNLLRYTRSTNDYFAKFIKSHNVLYGFVDGDLIAFNKFTAIKVINECQIYEFETDKTKFVNITMDELKQYFKQNFKQLGFVDDGNKWLKEVNDKVLVFEIQKSAFSKDYSYFNIGYASSISQAKSEHKKWDYYQRWLYHSNAESTFESIMQWFSDNDK